MLYLQRYGEPPQLGREEKALFVYATMEQIPVHFYQAGQVDKSLVEQCDLLAGSVESYQSALATLGLDPIQPNYYPESLRDYLGRRVWKGTLNELRERTSMGQVVFAKSHQWKLITGQVFYSQADCSTFDGLAGDVDMWFSEVISFRSEFRCYICHKRLLACCQYSGEHDEEPSYDSINEMITRLSILKATPASYSLDVGITDDGQTLLVEVGDGFSVGRYQGITDRDYYTFLAARWSELKGQGNGSN